MQSPQRDSIDAYFKVLGKIKATKKNQIINYFSKIKQLANDVNKDEKMLHYFNAMREYYTSDPISKDKHFSPLQVRV